MTLDTDPDTTEREYTVDALAAAAGTMTSTVRMYQARGLLAPPTKRGRVALYRTAHLQRLKLIAELQRRGHSLAGIAELLEGASAGTPLAELVGVTTWGADRRIRLSLAELAERFAPAEMSADELRRGIELGLVGLDGVDVLVDPRVLETGAKLIALGVPFGAVLDEWEQLTSSTSEIAKRFAALFATRLWPSLNTESASLGRVADVVNQLGPLAEQVTALALERNLVEEMERFIAANSTAPAALAALAARPDR